VSTSCIGVALFDLKGKLLQLTHVSPKVKENVDKHDELMLKSDLFKAFLKQYRGLKIVNVFIEEPLLHSNNINTVGILQKFNGLISRIVYDDLGVLPKYVTTYESRSIAFPDLLRENDKGKVVLFGGFPKDVDKKHEIWKRVADREPQITWLHDKKGNLKKECFDMSDAYTVCLSGMRLLKAW